MKLISAIPYAYRIAIMINASILLAMMAFGWITLDRQQKLLVEEFERSGRLMAAQLANSAIGPLFSDDALTLTMQLNFLTNKVEDVTIFDYLGNVTVREHAKQKNSDASKDMSLTVKRIYNDYRDRWLDDTPMSFDWLNYSDHNQFKTFVMPINFKDTIGGHVLVTLSKQQIFDAKQQILQFIMVVSVLIMIMVLSFSMAVGRRLSRPVVELIDATNALSEEEYSYRINKTFHGEFGQVVSSFNHMADEIEKKQKVESALNRFVSGSVATQFLSGETAKRSEGKMVDASVVFVDIVGFTSFSEQNSAQQVAEVLNEYFEYFAYCCEFYGGHVDKYIGDAAMLVFGAPNKDPMHSFNAVACAILIQKIVANVNKQRWQQGKVCLQVRIGINSGLMLAGVIGSTNRLQYTVVGEAVNLASRLCDLSAPDQILVDTAFFAQANNNGLLIPGVEKSHRVKGVKDLVSTVSIKGLVKEPANHYKTAVAKLDLVVDDA